MEKWLKKLNLQAQRRKAKHLSLIWKSKELLYSQEGSEVDWHRETFLEHMDTRSHKLAFSRTFQQSETSKGEIVFSCMFQQRLMITGRIIIEETHMWDWWGRKSFSKRALKSSSLPRISMLFYQTSMPSITWPHICIHLSQHPQHVSRQARFFTIHTHSMQSVCPCGFWNKQCL